MNLLEKAYQDLWQEANNYTFIVKHSGKFKGYNANIRRYGNTITIGLSKQWRNVSADIKKGLMQSLLVRLFKRKKHTMEMDLYNAFLRHVHVAVPKTKKHPILEKSFTRINTQLFNGLIEMPNLTLADSITKLGHYEYGTDTISISKHLLKRLDLLDYVMYHEMLHKHHKFSSKNGRLRHHTKKFREDEQKFPNAENLEHELSRFVTRTSRKRFFGIF